MNVESSRAPDKYDQAVAAFADDDFTRAEGLLAAHLAENPEDEDALSLLENVEAILGKRDVAEAIHRRLPQVEFWKAQAAVEPPVVVARDEDEADEDAPRESKRETSP